MVDVYFYLQSSIATLLFCKASKKIYKILLSQYLCNLETRSGLCETLR